MRRGQEKGRRRRSRSEHFLSVFFLGENRLTIWQRLLVILLAALLIAVIGDLLGVAARLATLFPG